MSQAYEETVNGTPLLRPPPGHRHEAICRRLHRAIHASVANLSSTRLLPPRTPVHLSNRTTVCPDLALVATLTGRLWLAAEIVSSEDHSPDTVLKKQVYEDLKLPRLWMIDPRYDNVEVYFGSQFGLVLKEILAGKDVLAERALPEFVISITDLFQSAD